MAQEERKVPVSRSGDNLIEREFDSIRDKFEEEMRKMELEMSRFRSQLIQSMDARTESHAGKAHATATAAASSQSSSYSKRTTRTSQQTTTSSKQQTGAWRPLDQGEGEEGEQATSGAQRPPEDATHAGAQLAASGGGGGEGEPQVSGRNSPQLDHQERHHHHNDNSNSKQLPSASWLLSSDDFANSPLISTDSSSGAKLLRLRFDVSAYEPEEIVVKTLDNRLQVHASREEVGENRRSYCEYNKEFLLPEGANPELIKSSLSADGVLTVEAPLGPQAPRAAGMAPLEADPH